jgi:hypothetical protein
MKHPADETPTPAMPWGLWSMTLLAGFGAEALAKDWFGEDAAMFGWLLAAATVLVLAVRYLMRRFG